MYKFLNKNIVLHSTLFLALLGYFFFALFDNSSYIGNPDDSLFNKFLIGLWDSHSLLMRIVTAIILILKLGLLQFYFSKNQFFENFNLFPSIIYLTLLNGICTSMRSGGEIESYISMMFFVNLFIILLLLLNSGYQPHSVKSQVFTSGFIIGLLFFADISTVLLLFFVMVALLVYRFSKLRDILLAWLGFSIPIIYAFAFHLFTNQYAAENEHTFHPVFFGFYSYLSDFKIIEIIAFIFMTLVLFYFSIVLTMIFSTKFIIMRKRLISINTLTITLFVMLFVTAFSYSASIVYLFVPTTVYCSIISQQKKNWILNNVFILLLIILSCL